MKSNVQEVMYYWKIKYLKKIGFPYVVNWSKHGSIVKKFLTQVESNVAFTKKTIDYIFNLELPYYDISQLLDWNINIWIQGLLQKELEQQMLKKVSKAMDRKVKNAKIK